MCERFRHGPAIMRNEDTVLFGGQRQNVSIINAVKARLYSALKIDCRIESPRCRDDAVVKVIVRLESYPHSAVELRVVS